MNFINVGKREIRSMLRTTCPVAGVGLLLLLTAGSLPRARATQPEICRVQGGNTKTVWGTGFDPGKAEVYAWEVPFDRDKAVAALGATPYRSRDRLPAAPPPGAKKLNVFDYDPQGRVMTVEFRSAYDAEGFHDARAGGHVCWVKNGDGFSKPWPVTVSHPWWVSPERALPGERVRIFGRNLDARMVGIKSRKDGRVRVLTPLQTGRNPLYECSVMLPEDLTAGEYDLYVHNGAGGEGGWGGPVKFSAAAKPPPASLHLNAREFGAKGNGVDDDTVSIRKALVEAGKRGGGVVTLPPGLYPISATLWVPSGVTLRGAGSSSSILTVLESNPMRFDLPVEVARELPGHLRERMEQGNLGAMVWMRDRSRVTDLGFVDGPGTLQAIFGSHDDCRIERCRIRAVHSTVPAVMVEWGSYGFALRDCEIEAANGGVFLVHGPHTQADISRNRIRALRPGIENTLFVRAFVHSVIEDNVVENGDRNFSSQTGATSGYHSILQGNLFRNNLPRRHNAGETMYESAAAEWFGKVLRATPSSLTVSGTPFAGKKLEGAYVLILDGRGLGQYRRVVSHTANTLAVEPAWDITPDASTFVTVGWAMAEHLWIDNTEEHTANWSGFWGNNYGHVVDGHVLRDGEGLYLWAWNTDVPSPVAFCDLIGSRTIGRGNITLRGPLVFGNTIRFSEVVDFRYRPSFHIQPTWLQGEEPGERFGIHLEPASHKIPGLPPTAPLKHWNVIEGSHVYDGPAGIRIAKEAGHTFLRSNMVHVEGAPLRNDSPSTVSK